MADICSSLITIFWLFDLFDLPFMQMFDTTVPINGVAWILVWVALWLNAKVGE